MAAPRFLYLGVRGSVVALDRASGEIVWSQRLKGIDFVNVAFAGSEVYATTNGEIFCLDADSGALRWHNKLKGYGLGMVTMAGAGLQSESTPNLAAKRQRDSEAAAAGAAAAS